MKAGGAEVHPSVQRDIPPSRRFPPCGARTKAGHPCPMRANLSGRCHVHQAQEVEPGRHPARRRVP